MSDNILELIKEKIKYEDIDDYIFKEKYGFIFVFKRKIFTLAPFSEKENVKEIVKEYVKTLL